MTTHSGRTFNWRAAAKAALPYVVSFTMHIGALCYGVIEWRKINLERSQRATFYEIEIVQAHFAEDDAIQESIYVGAAASGVKKPIQEKSARRERHPKSKPETSSTAETREEAHPIGLQNHAPHYPSGARRRGYEGVVELRATVGVTGVVLAINVAKSSGYWELDDAALQAVRAWRFTPAIAGGVAVESTVLVPVRFELGRSED